jgi:hypothetical protein
MLRRKKKNIITRYYTHYFSTLPQVWTREESKNIEEGGGGTKDTKPPTPTKGKVAEQAESSGSFATFRDMSG